MVLEYGSEEVTDGLEGPKEELLDLDVLADDGEGGIRAELDEGEWVEPPQGVKDIDVLLREFMQDNEVSWCGDPVDGVSFIGGYAHDFRDAFDTEEEYHASMDDYVDCGDGKL